MISCSSGGAWSIFFSPSRVFGFAVEVHDLSELVAVPGDDGPVGVVIKAAEVIS